MKKIEDIITEKITGLIYYYLVKRIKPDMKIENVRELTEEMIIMLKNELQIEGIIIDVDETLRKEMKEIPRCNQEWLDMVQKHLKIVILSNGKDKKIQDFFDKQGMDYIYLAHKPLKKNFLKACELMNVQPENVLVIGDNLIQDIHGGKRNNMKTIEVRDVEEDEER